MKTLSRRALSLSGVVAATFAFAPSAPAKTPTPSTPKPVLPSTKTAPAKTFDRALDADLIAAVKADDAAKVRSLLARNADPDVKASDTSAEPVLVTAVLNYNADMVRALVEAGANLEAKTVQGNSPLSMAALKGRVEISKYLLQRGAQVESADPRGATPLMLAARSGETDIVRALIAAGANVNARTLFSDGRQTPLHYACEDSNFGIVKLDIVKSLVEAGADASVQNGAEKTALEVAFLGKSKARNNIVFSELSNIEKYLTSIYGRDRALFVAIGKLYNNNAKLESSTRLADWQAVKDALATGASARFTDNTSGATTLIFASFGLRGADDATMQTLVARSNLDAREKQFGYTALHFAVTYNNLKLVGWLIQAGVNINILSDGNKTPLDLAAKNAEILALLKKAGAKTFTEVMAEATRLATLRLAAKAEEARLATLKMPQRERDIMLHKALSSSDFYASDVQKALDLGATARYADESYNQTALMLLAYRKSASDDIIATIVARADVNAVDKEGSSALHKAAWMGNTRLISALLKAGAKVNLVNKEGDGVKRTALDQAIEQKKTTAAALLRKAGAKTYAELQNPNLVAAQPASTKTNPKVDVAGVGKMKAQVQNKPFNLAKATALLKSGFSVNAVDNDQNTALHFACAAGSPEAVRFLLKNGANANALNEVGDAPLMRTLMQDAKTQDDDKTLSITKQLVAAGADVNAKSESGQTLVSLAYVIDRRIGDFLIQSGAQE